MELPVLFKINKILKKPGDYLFFGITKAAPVFFSGFMDRVYTYHKFRRPQRTSYPSDVFDRMVELHCVHAALTKSFADILHIDKNAVNAVPFCNESDVRPVCDVHQFERHNSIKSFF